GHLRRPDTVGGTGGHRLAGAGVAGAPGGAAVLGRARPQRRGPGAHVHRRLRRRGAEPHRRGAMTDRPARAALTGMDVVSAFGHGTKPLLDNVVPGRAAFGPVRRFDVADRRVGVAATMPGAPVLLDELVRVVEGACDEAGLSTMERAETPLLLAVHGDPGLARAGRDERPGRSAGALAVALAERCGLASALRAYT